ncbi:YpdA family putative bacillithiol disulfide reductase [Paenibacillus aurantius]|uniref:YpdA family putative bacillithiol disulfide reductase n=1 Tax=Paenibacillus aurantius TaxID=2918900 RepID=A0AA96LFF9_9BACL|nr:YpdA family putative bacillithiol disulfide reductase [Paenibacillus aurantius]WNQ13044.1 YpdA family putative bacillithiol disulfide reductase [Paenibacillus aurantius]
MEQAIVIGAGPCGLSAAIELKRMNIEPLILEKGSIVHSIYRYPTFLQFHSTAELLEIGNIPFMTPHDKPTRLEGLTYFRTVAERENLRIHTYETVTSLQKEGDRFTLHATDRFGRIKTYTAANVVVATGYFDHPNYLDIPGEDLPKVSHYYQEAHPYAGMKVAIVGGNNSAVDAAMDLVRVGADVTVIYRQNELSRYVKSWVRPVFESMIAKEHVRMLFHANLLEIREQDIRVSVAGKEEWIANDFVLALTGFRPDRTLLEAAGVSFHEQTGGPVYNPETMESGIPNLYIAGVVAAGSRANEIFIETGRFHGKLIAQSIASKADPSLFFPS